MLARAKIDRQVMREHNRAVVLDVVRRSGPVARTEVARRTSLAKPTVSAIVDELLTELPPSLAEWVRPNEPPLMATRPWVTPGTSTAAGYPLRYTARGESVYAFVQGATEPIELRDVASTPTTAVTTIDGTSLPWKESAPTRPLDGSSRPSNTRRSGGRRFSVLRIVWPVISCTSPSPRRS